MTFVDNLPGGKIPSIRHDLRTMLPTWAVAVLMPIPMATFWHEGSGRAFAYCYLFFGTAILTTERFRDREEGRGTTHDWSRKMLALAVAASGLCLVFTAFAWSMAGEVTLDIPVLAILAVLPALACVPYFTLRTGNPYAAIFLTVFLLGSIKIVGCVVVRIGYGPTALADGEMTLPWEAPNFLVWFCLIGALTCTAIAYPLGRRAFLSQVFPSPLSDQKS